MRAMVITSFGAPEVFQEMQVPRPQIRPGHVLIRVKATSVNPMDIRIRSNSTHPLAPTLPAILHADVAGIVEEVGEGVTAFSPGDEVYGCAGGLLDLSGALAEWMLADARLIALKPRSLSFWQAAALPLAGITAWEGIVDRANVQPGQKVLVHGATGGVGHLALQLAKWRGAIVTATASTEQKLKIATALGADDLVNYRQESVTDYRFRITGEKGFDVVFDSVGGNNLPPSLEAAGRWGQVVTTTADQALPMQQLLYKSLTLHVIFMLVPLISGERRENHGQILEHLAGLVDAGYLKPLIDETRFAISEVSAAHTYLMSGLATGKVVLEANW
ncbi:zinc-dependent alcohol dehydrogenase family protein [Deinococcus sp. SL84]|uniref:zinc-dependent alcohol dehydrogenase family protein n=1 Tax=Deinococcus sp. SL84 TaxID=2994663 RepID=UPI00227561E4|nr:zinc-dependent alcohol dehydrogenase family protein [Deinococcus sp. SL84]MCY1703872.1 zinc-dependent alcohol dehydrogenase family protein [Deinococcus sp. SL84]